MNNWIEGKDYPTWCTSEGLETLSRGYLLPGETPKQAWERCAHSAAKTLQKPELASKFFDLMWSGKLCLASPVLSNLGSERGLPISCNSVHVADNLDGIFNKVHEFAMLTKNGAGVGIYLGDIRGRGAPIKGNGRSEGIIPWARIFDTACASVSQGSVRRGAGAFYLPIEHADVLEFIRMRRAEGDLSRKCLNTHHGICISDSFMIKVMDGDTESREIWREVMRSRVETGEPYLFFTDNVNRQNPECYKNNSLDVKTSNICNEIYLHTDPDHTFVCCLSSLNLTRWTEFTDDDIYYSVWFLDAVLSEYIEKAKVVPGLEASVRSAVKGRALGLGVLGWHSLLQAEGTAFGSFRAKLLNRSIFDRIRREADRATQDLAKAYGEPEWCIGSGRRNTHTLAVAPTVSNSIISGSVSQGIEPVIANAFAKKTAKGTFISQNKYLKAKLASLGKDLPEIWASIATNSGSVQHLSFLSKEDKEVYKTAFEIDQMVIIEQAAERQKFIDQGQSINIFFHANLDPKEFHNLHVKAWQLGLKGLYYCRTTTEIKGDIASRGEDKDCLACHA